MFHAAELAINFVLPIYRAWYVKYNNFMALQLPGAGVHPGDGPEAAL